MKRPSNLARRMAWLLALAAGLLLISWLYHRIWGGTDPRFHAPETISVAAREFLSTMNRAHRDTFELPAGTDLQAWRKIHEEYPDKIDEPSQAVLDRYQPKLEYGQLGEVSAIWIKPKGELIPGKVLVYIHGGAFTLYGPKSTLCLSVPVADASKLLTVSLGYPVAPEAKWRQISDALLSGVQALMAKGYKTSDMALLGESAGGSLASALALRMRDEKMGLPAAAVLWSPWSDLTATGDTYQTLRHAEVMFLYDNFLAPSARAYADPKDQKHPWVSPVYGDYSAGYCPTLIQGGTKEIFLSNMVRHYQAIDQAGGQVKLDLYEGMWHVFQLQLDLPETQRAIEKTAKFLRQHLGS